uniref:Transcription factor WRKY7 n=1 Tax=Lilium regale TaxID=82328 RepID=A0A894TLA1_LILRE|nr:transcription factor WRKY7 [Lilium regale]
MSGDDRDHYHQRDLFFDDDLSYFSSIFSHRPSLDGHGLDPLLAPIMSSTNYGSFEQAFDLSSLPLPPLDVFGSCEGEKSVSDLVIDTTTGVANNVNGGSGVVGTPITPNSSVSWSSNEATGDNDSARCRKDELKPDEEVLQQSTKGDQHGGDGSKKLSKPRKKGEKRLREPRFAFMTVSEVDHLEDGYRWRKYGQKAVKDSPYPRSYYRCTTQKCLVKKRVERSFQDPKTVITTYEGQHTHNSPATIRGSSHMLAVPPTGSSSFLRYPLMYQQTSLNNSGQQRPMNPSFYLQNQSTSLQQLQLADYGLLQDIVPTFINNSLPK